MKDKSPPHIKKQIVESQNYFKIPRFLKFFITPIRRIYLRSDRFFHLLVGMPSYDKYLEHFNKHHPDKIPKTQKEFFKEAMEAKYDAGRNKC